MLLRLAEMAEKRGDPAQAVTYYREVLQVDPANTIARRQIARLSVAVYLERATRDLEAGQYDSAQNAVALANNIDPGNAAAAELLEKIEQARAAETKKRPPGE